MGSRLAVSVLLPGGMITGILLSPLGAASVLSPLLILFYCAAGTFAAACLATDYFAGQWARREFGWAPPGRVCWGVLWRTVLVFAVLLGLGWGLLAAYPFLDSLAWGLGAISALLGFFGTILTLGWSTMFVIHGKLRTAATDWEEDAGRWANEVLGNVSRPGAPRHPPSVPARGPHPAPAAAVPSPRTVPAQRRGKAAQETSTGPHRSAPQRLPVRPVPVASGKVHTKFWQNVVGGWEVEIAYTTEKANGNGASRRILYRTDRKPRPFGAPYGGFYSRPLAEEFARSHVEQGLELLNMETPLRRAPRYLIAGDLLAVVHPAGRVKIRDLSLGGACAEHDAPLRAAQDVTFAVDLPAGRFGTTARVVWSTPLKRPNGGGGGGGRYRSGFRFLAPGMQDLDILQAFFATV